MIGYFHHNVVFFIIRFKDFLFLQITPKFHGKVEKEGIEYVKMQDLLAEFDNPSVCDIKMGTR